MEHKHCENQDLLAIYFKFSVFVNILCHVVSFHDVFRSKIAWHSFFTCELCALLSIASLVQGRFTYIEIIPPQFILLLPNQWVGGLFPGR
jgi:hypothetical protein